MRLVQRIEINERNPWGGLYCKLVVDNVEVWRGAYYPPTLDAIIRADDVYQEITVAGHVSYHGTGAEVIENSRQIKESDAAEGRADARR